ncbi:peptidylprolyl isomerase, partial [Actinomycetota bacterium]
SITSDFMASLRESYHSGIEVDTEGFRNDLSENVFRVAITQQAETEFGISVTEAEVDDRLADPPQQWQPMFAELAADEDTTEAYARTQAELSLLRDEVAAALIREEDGFVEGILADTPQDLTAGCVRHILVDSEAEAEAVMVRLNAGEDFVSLADELTVDTVSAGDYVGGCPVTFGGLTPPVALAAVAAPLNVVVGPVQSEFGYHVILVDQRTGPPTLEEVTDDPLFYLPGATLSSFFTPWFNEVVRDSDISVADAVGRWSTAGNGIIPPGQ